MVREWEVDSTKTENPRGLGGEGDGAGGVRPCLKGAEEGAEGRGVARGQGRERGLEGHEQRRKDGKDGYARWASNVKT